MADDLSNPRHDTPPDGPEPCEEYTPAWSFSSFEEPDDSEEAGQAPAPAGVPPLIGHEASTLVQKLPTQTRPFEKPKELTTKLVTENSSPSAPDSPRSVPAEPAQAPARQPWVDRFADKPVMIEFENVTKVFRNQLVLRDLSFQVRQGETVCLIGESGCGKTVNLKLMIGLMKADKGTVKFKGENLARMNEKQITATRIKFGFLFQMAALFDSMSIYDNVAFGLREHRLMPESEMPA